MKKIYKISKLQYETKYQKGNRAQPSQAWALR